MSEQENKSTGPSVSAQGEGKYLLVVGGLLVVICAALAVLWVRERSARVAAETLAAGLQAQLQRDQLGGALREGMLPPGMLGAMGRGSVAPLRREMLSARTVECSGRRRQMLLVPAETGKQLGFEIGDLILISEPPAPATRPGATSRAAASKPASLP